MTASAESSTVTRPRIEQLLPYRYPLLLVDDVIEWNSDNSILTEYRVDSQNPLVTAHIVGGPAVMPGVMIIEMIGQAGLLLRRLSALSRHSPPNHSVDFLGRCKARFFEPLRSGDVARVYAQIAGEAAGGSIISGAVRVKENLIAEAEVAAKSIVNHARGALASGARHTDEA